MKRRIINLLFVVLLGISSCYYDNEEELYPAGICLTNNMSLQNNILPILERNCYVCHSISSASNTSNVTLEGYTELMKYVSSGKLMGAIRREDGYPAMPQNASKLKDCDIAKIEQWIADGALNN